MAVNINIVGQFDPKEIENARRALDKLREGGEKAGKGLKESLSGVADKMSDIGKSMSTKLTVPIVGAFGVGVHQANELSGKLREVVTLTGETGDVADVAFREFAAGVKDLSTELGVAQQTLTGGLYQALSAGVPRENAFEFMRVAAQAAIGGVTDTETAVDGLTTVINAFGLDVKDAQAVSDSLFTAVKGGKTNFEELSASLFNVAPAAAAAGVDFKEVNAAIATLTASGTPTSVATTQIRAALVGLQRPSEAMNKIFQELGYENAQLAIESEGLGFALQAVKDASGGNNGELQKLLGSVEAVAAANVLAGTGAEKFAAELEAQASAAGATADAFSEVDKSRDLERLKVSLQNLSIEVGNVLLPVVTDLTKKIQPWVERFGQLDDRTKKVIVAVLGVVAAVGPLLVILAKVIKAGITVATGLAKMARGFLTLGRAVAKNAVAFARWAAQTAVHAAKATASVVKAIALQIASWAKLAVKAMLSAVKVAAAWLIALGPIALIIAAVVALVVLIVKNFDTIKEVIGKAWEWIKATIERLWKGAVDAVSKGIAAVVDFFRKLPGRVAGAAGDLFRFLRDRMTAAKDWVWNRILDVIGFYRGLPGRLLSAAGDLFGFVRTAISSARDFVRDRITDMVDRFRGMPDRIRSALSGLGSALTAPFKAAFNAIAGLWNRTLGRVSFTVPDWVPGVGGKGWRFPTMPVALAKGGIVDGPTLAMLGDNRSGREAVIPLERANEFGFGGGPTYNVTVNALDPGTASRAVVQAIRDYERRNGSGWRR